MRVKVTSTLGDLAADCRTIVAETKPRMARVVRDNIVMGNRIARRFATSSSGRHGKLYPRTFSAEMTGLTSGEYGPDSAMPQGGMSFEYGSRNQPPHLDLARSADIIGPKFGDDVGKAVDGLFWPAR